MASNKALHRTAIPLRDIAAGELWRWINRLEQIIHWKTKHERKQIR